MTRMKQIRTHYKSFLLRVWYEEPDAGWRATLENVVDGEVQHFSDLQTLVDFLACGSEPAPQGDREEGWG